MEPPQELITTKRRPASTRDIIPQIHSNYVALMCNLVHEEPTYFEEESNKMEWMDAMIEE